MNKIFCPNCNKEVDYSIKENLIEKYRGKEVNIIEKVLICNKCNEEIFEQKVEQENFEKLYSKYRKVANIITPIEIINFRESYNISQREFVSILGWGKMTINRYERGSLPNQSHNDYLKLIIADRIIFEEVVETAFESQRINKKLYDKIKVSNRSSINSLQVKLIKEKLTHKKSIYNGFGKFDIDKVESIIAYIAKRVDNLYKTSLNKYLFYIDFLCYRENSISITGIRYIKYQYGPVIEERGYEDIINLSSNLFETEEEFNQYFVSTKIKCVKESDVALLKNYEIEVINRIIEELKDMNCTQISNLSHLEEAWKNPKINELISYEYADELYI